MFPSLTIGRRACGAVAILCCLAGLALAQDSPYKAYVNSADVYVRSGPGRDYYPTDKLQKGVEIEVYRHDPGGWLAIRPPRGSFSWVSSRHLDALSDDLAKVNSERVVARVGSVFSDVRDVIQVRLDPDERVELLEPAHADSPWCKVSPPAGEFRWIFSKYVDRKLPADLAADAREASAAAVATTTAGSSVAVTASGELARLRELEQIDMELSSVVVLDIEHWKFDDLRRRAEVALDAADGSLERGRARVLLDKLSRFESIKERHRALANNSPVPGGTKLGEPASGLRRFRRAEQDRYDGTGRLSPVVSQRTGGPQYALIDASGDVKSFVTPAPGVNLRPFVDKQIGVSGQRSYLTDMQRQHITVQRVSLLEPQRR